MRKLLVVWGKVLTGRKAGLGRSTGRTIPDGEGADEGAQLWVSKRPYWPDPLLLRVHPHWTAAATVHVGGKWEAALIQGWLLCLEPTTQLPVWLQTVFT